jgi:hypothetical protein
MYKEKLINYINNSPAVEFIINVDGEFVMVEFGKKDDLYFFLSTECKQNENGNYVKYGDPYELSLDVLNEDTCKIFVEKFESMILEQHINN